MTKIEKYKNIFLDRDGVINEVIIRGNEISSPRSFNEFKIRQEFVEFINNLKSNPDLFIVTNQPDVKRGFLEVEDLLNMHELIHRSFAIKKILYCPHDDDDNCVCRKPLPGMINEIIKEFDLCSDECLLIGDSHKDILAAKAANIDAVLLKTSYNRVFFGYPYIDSLKILL